MIREPKNVDFVTTGRELSEQDFARISEWIKQDKQNKAARKPAKPTTGKKPLSQLGTAKREA
jgi:cytochrome c553